MFTHDLTNGLSSLTAIVKGNTRHKVVEHVSLNNIMENMLADESKVTVNSGRSSTSKVPLGCSIVRKTRIGVLQVGNVDEPVVHPHPGEDVHDEHGEESKALDSKVECSQGGNNSNIANHNVGIVLLIKQRRSGNIVVLHPLGTTRVGLSSNVCSEIQDPAKQLLSHNSVQSANRGVLRVVLEAAEREESLLILGNKNHITSKMVGCLVVLGVG